MVLGEGLCMRPNVSEANTFRKKHPEALHRTLDPRVLLSAARSPRHLLPGEEHPLLPGQRRPRAADHPHGGSCTGTVT